ncbi:hypothetical protein Dimus_007045 [Dionaea muscipula]
MKRFINSVLKGFALLAKPLPSPARITPLWLSPTTMPLLMRDLACAARFADLAIAAFNSRESSTSRSSVVAVSTGAGNRHRLAVPSAQIQAGSSQRCGPAAVTGAHGGSRSGLSKKPLFPLFPFTSRIEI